MSWTHKNSSESFLKKYHSMFIYTRVRLAYFPACNGSWGVSTNENF